MNEWKVDRFGSAELALGHGLTLTIIYEGIERLAPGEPKFNVYVFGRRLKERAESMDSARRRAELAARKWLTEALNIVSGETAQIGR